MPIVYKKSTGEAVTVVHAVDAKEYVAGGAYSWADPTKKPELPAKSEAKPAVIPTVADKKPVVAPMVVEEKPAAKEDFKPSIRKPIATPKKSSRIIKK